MLVMKHIQTSLCDKKVARSNERIEKLIQKTANAEYIPNSKNIPSFTRVFTIYYANPFL